LMTAGTTAPSRLMWAETADQSSTTSNHVHASDPESPNLGIGVGPGSSPIAPTGRGSQD
jgi:hypothetical protein